jgi:citrate lyase subunit beta/citryl-CoA lyase
MSLGAEDFATEIGAEPTEEVLAVPKTLLLHAARAAGVIPLGLVGSLAGFSDLTAFQAMAERSRRMGYEGASCINPAQVAPINAAFTPGEAEVVYARRVIAVDAEARAQGRGAVALDGKMIDVPIVRRAERLLARFDAIQKRAAMHG